MTLGPPELLVGATDERRWLIRLYARSRRAHGHRRFESRFFVTDFICSDRPHGRTRFRIGFPVGLKSSGHLFSINRNVPTQTGEEW
jgi:hypothetical protein